MFDEKQAKLACLTMIVEYHDKNVNARTGIRLTRQRQLVAYHECLSHYEYELKIDVSELAWLRKRLDELIRAEMRYIEVPNPGIARFELCEGWNAWHERLLTSLQNVVPDERCVELQDYLDKMSGYRFRFTNHLISSHYKLFDAMVAAANHLFLHGDLQEAVTGVDEALAQFTTVDYWLQHTSSPIPPLYG